MYKRIVSLFLVLVIMFSFFVEPVLAINSLEDENISQEIANISTSSNAQLEPEILETLQETINDKEQLIIPEESDTPNDNVEEVENIQ